MFASDIFCKLFQSPNAVVFPPYHVFHRIAIKFGMSITIYRPKHKI